MLEALCRLSSTTLDIVHAEDGPPITQRTSGLARRYSCTGSVMINSTTIISATLWKSFCCAPKVVWSESFSGQTYAVAKSSNS